MQQQNQMKTPTVLPSPIEFYYHTFFLQENLSILRNIYTSNSYYTTTTLRTKSQLFVAKSQLYVEKIWAMLVIFSLMLTFQHPEFLKKMIRLFGNSLLQQLSLQHHTKAVRISELCNATNSANLEFKKPACLDFQVKLYLNHNICSLKRLIIQFHLHLNKNTKMNKYEYSRYKKKGTNVEAGF